MSRLLQRESSRAAYVPSETEVADVLRDNAALEARNAKLVERIADLERVIQRLWQRGRAAAPSPRGLRALAADAQMEAQRERQEAEEARQHASRSLREAMEARSNAYVTLSHLSEANATIESEKSFIREMHATDAHELTRRMVELQQTLEQERHKCTLLAEDCARAEAQRNADVGRLLAEMQAMRTANAENNKQQRQLQAELSARLDTSLTEAAALQVRHVVSIHRPLGAHTRSRTPLARSPVARWVGPMCGRRRVSTRRRRCAVRYRGKRNSSLTAERWRRETLW